MTEENRPPLPPHPGAPMAEEETLSIGSAPTEAFVEHTSTAERPSRLVAGAAFGRYVLDRPLGKGGFGEVWEATDADSGRQVALKVLTGTHLSAEARARFQREAAIAASLSHPNCVFVFAAAEQGGIPAIAMELLPGGTLQDVLEREGPLHWQRAVDAVLQLLAGLEAAHAKGILHRDLKPSNCFVGADGEVKVGDFGLSRPVEGGEDLTRTGTYLGTPAFSSPEQVRGRAVDLRSDVFSLGATLYCLLTGAHPFGQGRPGEIMARVLAEEPEPLASHGVEAPAGLQQVIRRMMAKDPARRFGSYGELAAALLPYSGQAPRPATLGQRFGAYMVDGLLLLLPSLAASSVLGIRQGLAGVHGGAEAPTPSLPFEQLLEALASPLATWLGIAAAALYFMALEIRFGWSLGKRLFGLRVLMADGDRLTIRAGAVRTSIFVGLLWVIPSIPGSQGSWSHFLAATLATLAVLAPMRRANGFAGLHEIASGTRVVKAAPTRRQTLSSQRKAVEAPVFDGATPTWGPFRGTAPLWRGDQESLDAAWDPELRRRVWIHQRVGGTLPDLGRRAVCIKGSLRWLQGSRGEGTEWDAWAAPEGEPLRVRFDRSGPLEWADAIAAMASLARALSIWRAEPDALPLTLEHLWLEPSGRLMVLPFPARADKVAGLDAFEPGDWRRLFQQALLLTLEGGIVPSSGLDSARLPRRPMPAFLPPVLEGILGGEAGDPRDIAAALEGLLERAPKPRLRRIAALLLVSLWPAAQLALAAMLVVVFLPQRDEPLGHLRHWQHLERQEPSPELERRKEAVLQLLGHAVATRGEEGRLQEEAALVQAPGGADDVAAAPTRRQQDEALIAELTADRGLLGTEERAAARRAAGSSPVESALVATMAGFVAGLLLPSAAFGLLLGFALRGGLSLRISGLAVQLPDGRPATRLRCAARALVAWSPVVLAPLAMVLYAKIFPRPWEAADLRMVGWWLVVFSPWLLFLAGAAYAALHPERGLQDRIAGTWLVPS